MGQGEIARDEQFLLVPHCFQKSCFPGASKGVIVWEWVNYLQNHKIFDLPHLKAFPEKMKSVDGRAENVVGK